MPDLILIQAQNWFFDYLIDSSFHGINRFFVLFENYEYRKSTTHNNKLILV